MYNINPLMRNVLLTSQEVIFHAPTKHTLDPRMIDNSIIVAEERFLREELGTALYADMANTKNKEITSGNIAAMQILVGTPSDLVPTLKEGDILNSFKFMSTAYQNLWKQFLWKVGAECVLISAYPEGFVQFSSEGTMHQVPPAGLMVTSGFVSPLLGSMKWIMDKKIQDRVGPLVNNMHRYICENRIDFGLYKKPCPDCGDDEGKEKWSGLAQGLYEDDSDKDCCGGREWNDQYRQL